MNQSSYTVSYDPTLWSAKPDKSCAGSISQEVSRYTADVTPATLAEMVLKGNTWCPGVFAGGHRTKKNWTQCQFFALDFDDGYTPEEAVELLSTFNVDHSFMYASFSDTAELRKFRIVFLAPEVVTDIAVWNNIQAALLALFVGKYDKNAVDCSRFFYGGKEILHTAYGVMDLDTLFHAARSVLGDAGTQKNVSRSMNKVGALCPSTEDEAEIGFLQIVGDAPCYEPPEISKTLSFDELAEDVKLLGAFRKGHHGDEPSEENRIRFDELKGLALNMQYIRGGLKWMKTIIFAHREAGVAPFTRGDYCKVVYSVRKDYHPMALSKCSPYPEDHVYNFITDAAAAFNRNAGPLRVYEPDTLTLGEAEAKMAEFFNEAAESTTKNVYLLKCPTGIGKTELLCQLNKTSVVAMPTHKLKDEVADRIRSKNLLNVITSPEMPKCVPAEVKAEMEGFFLAGLRSKATAVFSAYRATVTDVVDSALLDTYHLNLIQAHDPAVDSTLVTTHHKAVEQDFGWADFLVYDEDIMAKLLPLDNTLMEDILGITAEAGKGSPIELYFRQFLDERFAPGLYVKTEAPTFTRSDIIDVATARMDKRGRKFSANVVDLAFSDYWTYDDNEIITFITMRSIPQKKTLVMSATADINLYRHLFGDRLKVLDISHVEVAGSFEQDTKYSYSRSSLNNKTVVDHVVKMVNGEPTITFQKYKANFDNAVEEMHFGNTAGYDLLKGKVINVVGTPHPSPKITALYAVAMGKDLSAGLPAMTNQVVERNGFRFKFMTFDDTLLRDLHLGYIEGELIQAVGRARMLREQSSGVRLFSNFPLHFRQIAQGA